MPDCLGNAVLPGSGMPHPHAILECINARRFGVEYQPFVSVKNGEVLCHEALARFIDADGRAMAPDTVFGALHDNPLLLLHAELEMKRLQIAEAPPLGLLFVNLDPDSFCAGETAAGGNLFLPVLRAERGRLVVEIIENLHLQDVTISARMIEALDGDGIRMAIDDLSSSRGLVSYAALMSAAFVKFDRSWLAGQMNGRQRTLLTWALAQARDLGLTTVLEGIENDAHLALARQMGFDLVQGFLYRDRFIHRGCQPTDRQQRNRHPGRSAPTRSATLQHPNL